jgi:hypothetical protein
MYIFTKRGRDRCTTDTPYGLDEDRWDLDVGRDLDVGLDLDVGRTSSFLSWTRP